MTTATERGKRWKEVSSANPCPVCRAKQWCRVSPDGRVCNCRNESRGAVKVGTYRDGGGYYVHRLVNDGAKPNGQPKGRGRTAAGKSSENSGPRDAKPAGDGLTEAEASARDRAYRRLLSMLDLAPVHRDDLRRRGLTDEAIDAAEYRTLPTNQQPSAVKKLAAELGQDFVTVPGLVKGQGGPRINASPGLLVPVRDSAGRIIALVVRPDRRGDGGKYRWLSSRSEKHPDAPSPGSPAHVPQGIRGPVDVVRITEGQLKADVAYRLSAIPTLGIPGVDSWRRVLPILQGLEVTTVRVAFDADSPTNRNVARCLRDCHKELSALGYAVELERWPIEAGKGLDDVYAAGGAAGIEILTGPAAQAAAEEIAKAAGVDDRPAPDRPNEGVDDPHRLARLFVEQYGSQDGQPTFWNWRDEWQRWDGIAYRAVPGSEIRAEITRLVKGEFDADNLEAIRRYHEQKAAGNINLSADKGPPQCRKVTAGLVTNVSHALASERLLPGAVEQPTWIEGEGPFPAVEVLATASGLLHLPSLAAGEPCLVQPTPAFFSGNALAFDFAPEANCSEWLRFLDTLWPDDRQSIEALGEWFGYCLTPDTRQHKLLMLIGPPRSGKGTIARVLRGVIGEQNLASPTLASLAGPFGLWPLVGKLVALIADARLSGRADAIAVVERLLSISGEDPQDVARKNLPTLAGIRLPVRFVVMTNELPNMRDASGALTTRVILLRLTRTFRGREDKTLGSRLLGELPGILNWSIRGWQRLQERGAFVQPDSGQELLDDLADLASPIGAFVRDRCIVGPEFTVGITDLFSDWRSWCETHGREHPGTQQTFGRDLRAAVPQVKVSQPRGADGSRERFYAGIGLRR